MEIQIAVCDDELEICMQIEKQLIYILDELSFKYDIDCFLTGEELCNEMKKERYDLIFLDIELPNMSGVQIGKYIRETLKNEIVQIAYISSKQEYAMELFDFRPINFLIKPLTYKNIRKVIDKYMIVTEQEKHMFTYKKRFNFFKVPLSDILYFENKGRRVTIVTKEYSDEFYESMESIYSRIKGQRFLYIHKSIIVNYNYIKKIGYEKVIMLNGEVLPISQSRRKEIRSMYLEIRKKEEQ